MPNGSSDGSIIISTHLDNQELETELSRVTRKIQTLEERIGRMQAERMPLADQSAQLAANLDEAKARLDQMKNGPEYFSRSSIQQQESTVRQLQAEWDRVQGRVERYDANIQNATRELNRQRERAGSLSQQLAESGRQSDVMGNAMNRASKYMNQFLNRVKALARRVFIFTLITTALRSLRTWMWETIKTNEDATAAVARLKAALLTLVQPLVNVVIPAFIAFVNLLTDVVSAIAKVVASLFGVTLDESKQGAKDLYDKKAALEGVGSAAKKAGKSLASFDEINKLSNDSGNGGGAGGSKSEIAPDFSFFDKLDYKKKLDEMTVYISGALLALGAILAFTGVNIPLGIGLMALGAIGLASVIKENWDSMDDELKGAITKVLLTLGTAALVFGAILAFSGVNIPLGIGLMIAGVAAMATAAALNWDTLDDNIKDVISGILATLGLAMLVIGAVLAFSGANIPLGIGLMLVGALAMASAIALNWDVLKNDIGGVVSELLVILGAALLAIGAALAFSGANLPLGIGLMAVGALALGAAAALNWETIEAALKGPIGAVTAAVSAALLALGAVLAFTGVALPLGIALMAAGAIGLATVTFLNWDTIKNKLQGPIGAVTAAVSAALLAIGAILAFTGVALPLGIALMAAGAIGLATVVYLNWDTIKDALQGPIGQVTAVVSAALLVLGIILCCTGVALPLGIALIAAGAVGLVTTVALNWDAILDGIKGAWSRIRSWWDTNVAPKLTLAYWQEKFETIKEALVQKIKDAVNGAIALFNQFIDWVNDKLNISWDPVKIGGVEIISGGSFQLFKIPHIPALAQGAVIPPNREFMAILGDQKSGTNIEAPMSTIEQGVENVLRRMGVTGGSGDTTVILELDGQQFGKVVYKTYNRENRRIGVRLVEV